MLILDGRGEGSERTTSAPPRPRTKNEGVKSSGFACTKRGVLKSGVSRTRNHSFSRCQFSTAGARVMNAPRRNHRAHAQKMRAIKVVVSRSKWAPDPHRLPRWRRRSKRPGGVWEAEMLVLLCVFEGRVSRTVYFAIVAFDFFTTAPSIQIEVLILPCVFEGQFPKSTGFTQVFRRATTLA